jgi:hypothetical protein
MGNELPDSELRRRREREGGREGRETRLFKVGAESALEELRIALKEGQEEVVEVADRVAVALKYGACHGRAREDRKKASAIHRSEPTK